MEVITPPDPELEMLRLNKESGFTYRLRRQEDWLENYMLYRDKVIINRLTQRQSVNLPLMKQTIRTLLKDVDDMPNLFFQNLDNDKQAEVFKNEYWKWTVEQNHMDLQDIVDKRQVFLFGRGFDQWQVINGMVKMTVQDPEDIAVSRYVDPFNLHSARFLTHTHIFVPLSSLRFNPDYEQTEVTELMKWFATKQGIVKAAENQQMLIEKNKKMEAMGVPDVDSPILGETYVELSMHFVVRDKEERKGQVFEDQLFLYVEAENERKLMKKPLEEVIGATRDHFWQTHFPYNSWADDLERQDFWSDGIADMVRTPNKVLNSWFSQLVENRTLRNFGMHYYNNAMTAEGFSPNTFNPIPWGWYGIPVPTGMRIADAIQKVDIPDLSESMDEMTFLLSMVEKASGATATQQGVQTERTVTLGEVQLALGEAKERIKGMSKFYTPAWQERGQMFVKLVEAAGDKLDAVRLHKKGRNTDNLYSRDVGPGDWMTKSGYVCKVWSQDEKRDQDTQKLQKLNAAKTFMPDNPKLDEIYQRKLLEFSDLTPEEINEVMEYERQKKEMLISQQAMMPGAPGMGGMGGQQPMLPAGPAPMAAQRQISV